MFETQSRSDDKLCQALESWSNNGMLWDIDSYTLGDFERMLYLIACGLVYFQFIEELEVLVRQMRKAQANQCEV